MSVGGVVGEQDLFERRLQACIASHRISRPWVKNQPGHRDARSYMRGVKPGGVSYGRWRVSMSMKSMTCTVAIEAPTWKVFNFLADPQKLTCWAITSAVAVPARHGWWEIRMPRTAGLMRMQPNAVFGVVDFNFIPAQGRQWSIPTRVLPDAEHSSELTVTVFPPMGFGSREMDCSLAIINRKLDRLKGMLEGRRIGTEAPRRVRWG